MKGIKLKIPKWLISLLFIFALSMIGLGISVLVGFYLPLWLLFGFSLFFSIEKWLYYPTRKYKYLGKLYRLILNLSILSLLGFLVWSGIKLFSSQFTQSALIGSLLFVAELIFFIWMWRVVARNSWRWPSMKLTIISLIALAIIFAFAGVQPIASYKDNLVNKWDVYWEEQRIKNEERQAQEELEEQERIQEQELEEQMAAEEQAAKDEQERIEQEIAEQTRLSELEHEVVLLVNLIRADRGIPMLMWDDTLYQYSKAHSIEMAERRDLFHSPVGMAYAENAWGGEGSKSWGSETIVEGWMNSSKHRTWLLCPHLQHIAVGIAYSSNGMYASWTFWIDETIQSDWWYQYTPDNPPEWWY